MRSKKACNGLSESNLEKNLNLYSFLTLKLVEDDLYPHYSYGKNFSINDIKSMWVKTVADIVRGNAPKKLGLYVHIPFCRQKCSFCFCDSFVPYKYSEAKNYLRRLISEISEFSAIFKPVSFTSVYFGGGTPSFFRNKDLETLFRHIYKNFNIAKDAQIIFEATPPTLNEGNIKLITRWGVNRLTIGVQSLDPKVLEKVGRKQTKEQFARVYKLCRENGIDYINIDLIAGLEGQTVDSFINDLNYVLSLNPDVVHVTGFTPLRHTIFCKSGKEFKEEQKKSREIMIKRSREILNRHFPSISHENAGKNRYARNVQEADLRRQNSSLLGIGYGAQSHAFTQIWYQHPHAIESLHPLNCSKLPLFIGIKSSAKEEMRKFIVTNLRSGFSRKLFYSIFKNDVLDVFRKEIQELQDYGKIEVVGDNIISKISNRKEYLVLSKHLYSKEMINMILSRHKKEHNTNIDYYKELDRFFAITD